MPSWSDIAVQISASINTHFDVEKTSVISGGCINQAYCIEDDKHRFFVKLNKTIARFLFSCLGVDCRRFSWNQIIGELQNYQKL